MNKKEIVAELHNILSGSLKFGLTLNAVVFMDKSIKKLITKINRDK